MSINAKKAKQLRRVAQLATVGLKPISRVLSASGKQKQIEISETSTRGVYLDLKNPKRIRRRHAALGR